MKKIIFVVLILSSQLLLAQTEKYSRAKVFLNEPGKTIKDLQTLGIAVDHGEYKKGISFTSDFSATELKSINNAGFKTEIIIDDVSQYYIDQNNNHQTKKKSIAGCVATATKHPIKPSHFHLGSYGGYYTYAELLAIIDSMRLLYPNLISAKQPIDTFHSIEGRPIYWLRVSNHPDSNQVKPQMVYTALHHAREPASISQMVYYLWYLLENYATDAQVQTVVDNAELYFVPCLNPDGYLFNQTTNPMGGGMWRKNRRDNLDGTFGVDLNRNYGFNWGYDNIGSSNLTSSDTYRGDTAFSEPETKAIKWFCEHHTFLINLNYHTYSNDIIYPWGYIASFKTPDSTQFDAYGAFLTQYNHYKYGTGDQTVGYVTNGDSDDWGYGEQTTKNKTYSFTPEVGPASSGFYPPATDIEGLCADNLFANLNAAKLILQYAQLKATDKLFTNQLNNHIHYTLQRLGMANGATFTVSATPLDSWITAIGASKTFSNLNFLQTITDSISYTLNAAITNGQLFRFVLKVNNGIYDETDTIVMQYHQYATFLIINNSTTTDWDVSLGTWNTTTATYVSAPNSITDSPLGNYADNTTNIITLKNEIDLTNAIKPMLGFYCKWQIEKDYDYAVVEASDNNGISWTPLCGLYTHDGTINQWQGQPIYDGDYVSKWVNEQMPLDNFINKKIKIRFQLVADQAVNMDGFYFDDMKIFGVDTTLKNNLGIETTLPTNKLNPYPNPCGATVFVTNHSLLSNTIEVMDVLGRKQNAKLIIIANGNYQLNTEGMCSGLYFIKATDTNGNIMNGKFIKE
ncbi:MAG: hypothetical protein RJA07_2823 [Bacteroidota bacterium]|jgi:hypothetical protein